MTKSLLQKKIWQGLRCIFDFWQLALNFFWKANLTQWQKELKKNPPPWLSPRDLKPTLPWRSSEWLSPRLDSPLHLLTPWATSSAISTCLCNVSMAILGRQRWLYPHPMCPKMPKKLSSVLEKGLFCPFLMIWELWNTFHWIPDGQLWGVEKKNEVSSSILSLCHCMQLNPFHPWYFLC